MKRILTNVLFLLISFVFLPWSCKNDFSESELYTIPVENPVSGLALSDIFQLDGFVRLHVQDIKQGLDRLRSLNKVLFTDRQIIVLDNKTDFQNIWLFDRATGAGLGKCAYPNSEPGSLQDIDLGPDGTISCLTGAHLAFLNFDANGALTGAIKNGIIGDQILRLPNGGYLAYNEYSATDISGFYQLLLFDKAGNLVQRLYPYDPALDDIGYTLSGFVSRSDEKTWFSPPFCDTVYQLANHRLIPRYRFSFGNAGVPEQLRTQKLGGWDIDPYIFLEEDFLKINHFVLFSYYSAPQTNLGVFDERSGSFLRLRDAARDHLYPLMRAGRIFRKDDYSFAFLLTPARIRYLLQNNRSDLEALKESMPELYAVLTTAEKSPTDPDPLLLYFSFKPDARIEARL